ncbi:MAG: hypothetical protein DSZ32_01975 [Gammaproteobacteria bacterium]|nr:MAG: hypothetical protein DSZ32_01975 [Gammaproteobacteria bacterium]
MKRIFTVLMAVAVILLVVTIMMKNQQPGQINYYLGFSHEVPMWLIIFVTFSFGVLAGWLTMGLSLIKTRTRSARLRREIKKKDRELASYRDDNIEETS